jgi:hypothetical protein
MAPEGEKNKEKSLITRDNPRGIPALISGAGNRASKRFLEFFTANIRNGICFIFFLFIACPALAQEAGKVVSLIGRVELLREGRRRPVSLQESLSLGDALSTGPGSRVAVLLADGSQLKLNAHSRLVILKRVSPPRVPVTRRIIQTILSLLSGEIWVRNRGEPLEIETVAATATIRGTELNLAVEPVKVARLKVVEGVVDFRNPQGSVLVAAGEQASARPGEAPRKTVLLNPLDAVQWSFYYPGIVSYRDYPLSGIAPSLLRPRLTEMERRRVSAPQDVNVRIELGEILFDLGRRTEARQAFELMQAWDGSLWNRARSRPPWGNFVRRSPQPWERL